MTVNILRSPTRIAETGDFVLTTNGRTRVSGFSRAKLRFDEEMTKSLGEPPPRWVPHDQRRTSASGIAGLGMIEAVLNHTSGQIKGVAKFYNRRQYAEEKREALAKWTSYVGWGLWRGSA